MNNIEDENQMPDERDYSKFLSAISNVESSGGKNLNHPLITYGMHKGDRAIGEYGIMPNTAQEMANRLVREGNDSDELREITNLPAEEIRDRLESNKNLYNTIAKRMAKHVFRDTDEPLIAAYRWHQGHNKPAKTITEENLANLNESKSNYLDKFLQKYEGQLKNIAEKDQGETEQENKRLPASSGLQNTEVLKGLVERFGLPAVLSKFPSAAQLVSKASDVLFPSAYADEPSPLQTQSVPKGLKTKEERDLLKKLKLSIPSEKSAEKSMEAFMKKGGASYSPAEAAAETLKEAPEATKLYPEMEAMKPAKTSAEVFEKAGKIPTRSAADVAEIFEKAGKLPAEVAAERVPLEKSLVPTGREAGFTTVGEPKGPFSLAKISEKAGEGGARVAAEKALVPIEEKAASGFLRDLMERYGVSKVGAALSKLSPVAKAGLLGAGTAAAGVALKAATSPATELLMGPGEDITNILSKPKDEGGSELKTLPYGPTPLRPEDTSLEKLKEFRGFASLPEQVTSQSSSMPNKLDQLVSEAQNAPVRPEYQALLKAAQERKGKLGIPTESIENPEVGELDNVFFRLGSSLRNRFLSPEQQAQEALDRIDAYKKNPESFDKSQAEEIKKEMEIASEGKAQADFDKEQEAAKKDLEKLNQDYDKGDLVESSKKIPKEESAAEKASKALAELSKPEAGYAAQLAQAMTARDQGVLAAQLGSAATKLGAGIAGAMGKGIVKAPEVDVKPFEEQMALALKIPERVKEKIEIDRADPSSEVSKSARAFIKQNVGVSVPDNVSAASLKEQFPVIEKYLQAKENAATRKILADTRKEEKQTREDERTGMRLNEKLTAATASSRSVFGKAAAVKRSIESARALVAGKDLNQITSTEQSELARVLDSILAQGSPTVAGMKKLDPKTALRTGSEIVSFLTSKPVGAQSKEFIKRFIDILDREYKVADSQIKNTQNALFAGARGWKERNPEWAEEMMQKHGFSEQALPMQEERLKDPKSGRTGVFNKVTKQFIRWE